MISEPLLLTLLFAIAATAVIGAINARDSTRMVISSVLALFCVGAAIFKTAQYLGQKTPVMDLPAAAAPAAPVKPTVLPPTFPISHDTGATSATDEKSSAGSPQSPASPELGAIADGARQLQNILATINMARVTQMDEADYIRLREKASTYVSEATKLQNRMAEIAASPPSGWEEPVETLNGAIKSLIGATRDMKRFFNAESGDEERACAARFRSSVQSAGFALNKIESRLSGTAQSAAQ